MDNDKKDKRVKVHIWINGELVSISEFDLTIKLVTAFIKNVEKFLLRMLDK